MKKYSKTKDSEIKWIGEIPEKLEKRKISKCISKITNGYVGPTRNILVDDGVKYLQSLHIKNGKIKFHKKYFVKDEWSKTHAKSILKEGDVLVVQTGGIGECATVTKDFENCNCHALIIIRLKDHLGYGTFLSYFLRSNYGFNAITSLKTGAIHPHLEIGHLKDMDILLPSKDEQEKIVQFLEDRIPNIDVLLSKMELQIEKLKEKKQAVIDFAVTRGLDSDIPLKDSKIQRIGQIPEHWNLNKIKFISYVKGRIGWQGLRSDEFTDEGPYLITGTDFKDGHINWKMCNHVEKWRYEQDPYIQITKNDILITKDCTIGKVAFIDSVLDKTTLNSGVLVIRPLKKSFYPRYMYWILKSSQFTEFINMIKSGSTIQHLYQETFENFQFVLPETVDEQEKISEFLDNKTNEIDQMLNKLLSQFQNLQDFRTSLITSAVTGKIDVREAIA